ncbi:MAG: YggS family pyridoxal phosphate-dependent enzyme [Saprospiraceae bacterium]|nr:YggS family pyridoxal phosphate-dependent enzyme [Saprospiraceae bacterium]
MHVEDIKSQLQKNNTKLVAVSKTKPNEAILSLYENGQLDFGENRVQELVDKYESLPKDIRWHMIGHLQTNKVKYIAPFIHLIHSVDSEKVLKEINKQAKKEERVIDCLLQFHIAEEESKYGFDLDQAMTFLKSAVFQELEHVRIVGVMGMATFTEDEEQVKMEFRALREIFELIKKAIFEQADYFKEISMGMSGDYQIAMEEGSTMVRIGSLLFGARNYG